MKKPQSLAQRVATIHSFAIKLGPHFGGAIIKLSAYFTLYKVFTAGGVEALAFVCYEHSILTAERERAEFEKEKKKHGTQKR